jgi:hypothetical protein
MTLKLGYGIHMYSKLGNKANKKPMHIGTTGYSQNGFKTPLFLYVSKQYTIHSDSGLLLSDMHTFV